MDSFLNAEKSIYLSYILFLFNKLVKSSWSSIVCLLIRVYILLRYLRPTKIIFYRGLIVFTSFAIYLGYVCIFVFYPFSLCLLGDSYSYKLLILFNWLILWKNLLIFGYFTKSPFENKFLIYVGLPNHREIY
jgi:hypothetical protein